jgi:four helix bundle protein
VSEGGASWTFEDLEVFKRSYALSLALHRASLDFPKIEQYGGIADQLRRSSKAVCALIAEGAGRQRSSQAEFKRYLTMALGSIDETRLWCRYVVDLGYAEAKDGDAWREECRHVARMLQGLLSRVERGTDH